MPKQYKVKWRRYSYEAETDIVQWIGMKFKVIERIPLLSMNSSYLFIDMIVEPIDDIHDQWLKILESGNVCVKGHK